MFPARRNVFRKYSRQSHFITRQVLWKEAQKLQQSPYCQCFRTHRIWTSLWVDTFIVTEFRAQRPCVITHVSAFWLQCLRSECHVYESRSVICLQGGWLATGRVSRIPPPLLSLPPSLSLSSAAAIFSSSGASTAKLDRFALIVPDELLHFLANVSQSAIGKERNEGKSLPPWRCHFHTLGLAACQQTGQSKKADWTLELRERKSNRGWDWFMSASFLHNLCAPNKHTGELRLTPFILSYPGSFVITEITL